MHFLFYFGNVAEPNIDGKEEARVLIKYLREATFQLFYERFSDDGELNTEIKSYYLVKSVLRHQFRIKNVPVGPIEYVLSVKLGRNDP